MTAGSWQRTGPQPRPRRIGSLSGNAMMPCDVPGGADRRPPLPLTVEGGCHCGAVRFRATLRSYDASACNCSMCTKKAYTHLIVPKEDFTLLTDRDAFSTYRFNTRAS